MIYTPEMEFTNVFDENLRPQVFGSCLIMGVEILYSVCE
jgi:hypothetical protein